MNDVAISTGRGPWRSASAPTKGCDSPQTMFCTAIAKPKVAAEMPKSRVIGRMNSPRLWRIPMQIEMMIPLRTSRTSSERDEESRDREGGTAGSDGRQRQQGGTATALNREPACRLK